MKKFLPWKVHHFNLEQGISALPRENGRGGIFAVFWHSGVPLGHLMIPSEYLPKTRWQMLEMVSSTFAASVGDHLLSEGYKATLPIASSKKVNMPPPDFDSLIAAKKPMALLKDRQSALKENSCVPSKISLVICTRDRTAFLKKCLHSVENARLRPDEVIVVDNAPTTEDTYLLVKNKRWINYVRENRLGLSVSRNTGIRNCTCEIIAFTDDDVIVHPDWFLRLIFAFKDTDVLAVTGLVLPFELRTRSQLFYQTVIVRGGWGYRAQLFDSNFFQTMKNLGVPVWQIGAGANMAFRRQVFELVGEFDERLGAGAAGCSEDSEIWYRILAEGWHCSYNPTAVVFHHHRNTMNALKKQMRYYMRGHVAALLVQFEKYRHWGNLYRALLKLPRYYLKRMVKNPFRLGAHTNFTLGAEISGYLSGWIYYLTTKLVKKNS